MNGSVYWRKKEIKTLAMKWKIEIYNKFSQPSGVAQDIIDLGIDQVESINFSRLYFLEGNLSIGQVEQICSQLLADRITENYRFYEEKSAPRDNGISQIEVVFKSGVTDTVAENICKGIGDLDISCLPETITAQTGRQYNFRFRSDQTSPQSKRDLLEIIATRLLANEVIESFNISM